MRIETGPETLRISEIGNLESDHAPEFIESVSAALGPRSIEIDLSTTARIDAVGLGALAEIYRRAVGRDDGVSICLRHAPPTVRHVLELGRLHHVFEIPVS